MPARDDIQTKSYSEKRDELSLCEGRPRCSQGHRCALVGYKTVGDAIISLPPAQRHVAQLVRRELLKLDPILEEKVGGIKRGIVHGASMLFAVMGMQMAAGLLILFSSTVGS